MYLMTYLIEKVQFIIIMIVKLVGYVRYISDNDVIWCVKCFECI